MIEHLSTQNINQALFLSNDEILIKGKMMQRVKIEIKQGESAKYHLSNIKADANNDNEDIYRMIISEDLENLVCLSNYNNSYLGKKRDSYELKKILSAENFKYFSINAFIFSLIKNQ